jgi:asparagine synthase (glutamine-hydrolysing)
MYVRLLNMSWLERLSLKSRGLNKVFGVKLRPYRRLADYPASRLKLRSRFNEVLRRSHSGGLVNLLHYGDAISMANSLESRLPFMDVNLVEYVFRLPYQMKAQLGVGKFIHRYAMKGIVPDFILSNPLKFGFNTPLTFLFAKPESEANRILLSDQCLQRGIFDERGLRSVIADQTSGRKDNSTFLFRLLSVELWFRRFIDCEQGLPSASGELMGSVRLSGAGGL